MNENIYVYGDIKIKGFEALTLSGFSITQEINQHGEVKAKAMIPEEVQETYLGEFYIGKGITILLRGENVFSGIITELTICNEGGLCYADLTALTYTCLSDLEKKKRSWQDQNRSYADLISDVVLAYDCTSFIGELPEITPIGDPIIQYQETDWEFLKRMASRFHVPLLAFGRDPKFKFYFGFSKPPQRELISNHYKVKKEGLDFREQGLVNYEVITDQYYDLGDCVTFQGKTMYLSKSVFEYKQAVIQNTCTLSFADGCYIPRIPNTKLAGCSLFGRVLATARDCIKLHLEIDQTQDTDTAFWFPYATMYASQQETGWYCMPETGDTVRLYFPEQEEREGMAINSIKPHDPEAAMEGLGAGHPMSNPDVKYIRTTYGKEIKFRTDGMDIIAKDGTVFMTLNDDGTMYLNSNGKISMTAVNQIEMKAPVINFEALNSIQMKGKSSSILLDQEIAMKGNEIKNN